MFAHHCTSCTQRQLIFPSQVTSLVNTDHGIIAAFTCWCGSEQTLLTGRNAGAPAEVREDAVVAA
ncbi:hypothetical protein [Nocardioides lianchengensis]|uniref:Uncharacterized protein n=1 Tax=Nocardioides lianchengensis TaxID=1045774 RepID=A0A1G6PV23_9ACTN|nr:hypothetical protein [Nocardioides lianchengensis]NYG11979.1 hypothetical protein [Nocardioides lianchengensis]SDC83514.1 hypothetical protein SAMN05421872_104147 [Nocardioides lianchengensis]